MTRLYKAIFIIIPWLLLKQAFADDIFTPQIIQKINITNGFVDSPVTAFQSDERHRLWIATSSGLFLYDGKNARLFTGDGNLHEDYISTLLVAGDVLFVGSSKGLFSVNLKSLSVEKISAFQYYQPTALAIADERLFVGTMRNGLFEYELESTSLTPIDLSKFAASKQISTLSIAPDKSLWVGVYATDTKDGFLTGGLFQVKDNAVSSSHFTDSIVINNGIRKDDHLYIAAGSKGIKIFSLSSQKEVNSAYPEGSGNVKDLTIDRNGCLWTSEMGGVGKLCDSSFRFYPKDTEFFSSLDATDYLSAFYDKNTDIIWLGGYNGGARGIFIPEDNQTQYASPSGQKDISLTSSEVYAISVSANNQLWVGYNGQGIDIVDEKFKKIKNIAIDDEIPRANHVISMLHLQNGDILVGTFGAGLWISKDDGNTFGRFIDSDSQSVNRSVVTGIAFDSKQQVYWIATIRELYKVSQNGNLINSIPYTMLKDNALIYDVEIVNDHVVVLATGAGALLVESDTLTVQYPTDYAPHQTHCHGEVLDFAKTDNNQVVFVADTYCQIDSISLNLQYASPNQPLEIAGQAIIVDSVGRYVSANAFLSILDTDGVLSNIGFNNGLLLPGSPPFSGGLVEFSAHYIFATPSGLAVVKTNINNLQNLPVSKMFLESMFVNNQVQQAHDISDKKFDVPPNERFISLSMRKPEYFGRQIDFYLSNSTIADSDIGLSQISNVMLPTTTEGYQKSTILAKYGDNSIDEVVFEYDVLEPLWRRPYMLVFYILALIVGFYIVYLNRVKSIKDQKAKLQREVEIRTKELKEALDSNETMFENVSHELRTPLTIVLGTLEKIRRSGAESTSISIIERQSSRLLALVDSLLKQAEIKHLATEIEKVDVAKALRYHIESFSSLLDERGLSVVTNSCHDIVPLRKGAYDLLMVNLLSNACKYATENTEVVINVCLSSSDQLSLTMENRCLDIDSASMKERFTKGTNENTFRASSGLGLDIINSLIGELGGRFEFKVTSAVAVSKITIPIANKEQSETESQPVEPNVRSILSKTDDVILIVEDNDELMDFLKDSLDQHFKVACCRDGFDALRYLGDCERLPSLVLSDVVMPKMNGYELCESIKSNGDMQSIPVVLMTAKGDQQSIKLGYASKADDYIVKPFNTEVLCEKLNNLISTVKAAQEKARSSLLRGVSESPDEITTAVNTFLSTHYTSESISPDSLATELNISAKTLNRRLQQRYGYTFSHLLREYRLEIAGSMLLQGKSAKEVCFSCGFANQSHFGQCFKEKFGVSPAKYSSK
jgi:DNA-binding response OmpR family regulator/signal transduction histidine kinase/ligand-binding sensor domain-containing protein